MSEAATAPAPEAPASAPAPTAAPDSFLGSAAPAPASGGEPSSAPAHLFGEHIQADGSFKEGWTSALAEKFPRLANTAMRYKTEADFLQGMDHALGLVGKKTAGVSYPKEGATPEEIAAFRAEAGVPMRPEEYNLKPEKLPDFITWTDDNAKKVAEVLHAHHVPEAAAKALVQVHLENITKQAEQEVAAQTGKLREMIGKTTQEFQKEWGVDYDARRTANIDFVTARFTPEDLADPMLNMALSHPAIVRIVDEARRASRESPLPGVNAASAPGSMSPRQQAMDIMTQNPQWRNNPELSRRVNDLYAQEAAAQKRRGG